MDKNEVECTYNAPCIHRGETEYCKICECNKKSKVNKKIDWPKRYKEAGTF